MGSSIESSSESGIEERTSKIIAVYNPENKQKKAVAEKLLRQGRVNFITPANYSHYSRTFKVVCSIIDKIKADYVLKRL